MSLKDKISQDFVASAKSGDKEKKGVLSMLLAALKNTQIEKRAKLSKKASGEELEKMSILTDEEIIEVLARQIKQRRDSVDQYTKGNRMDLADKESAEIRVLEQYLPRQLSEAEIREIVKKGIAKTGAASPKDMGKVMGAIMPEVKGKADGTLVSKIVKEELSK